MVGSIGQNLKPLQTIAAESRLSRGRVEVVEGQVLIDQDQHI